MDKKEGRKKRENRGGGKGGGEISILLNTPMGSANNTADVLQGPQVAGEENLQSSCSTTLT